MVVESWKDEEWKMDIIKSTIIVSINYIADRIQQMRQFLLELNPIYYLYILVDLSVTIGAMANETRDEICIRIENKMQAFTSTYSEHTLFKVPLCISEINPKAYEPQIISIGPYHHGKLHLKMMEDHKVRFLKILLGRTPETTIDRYVASMRGMVEKVRNCYAESLNMSNENLIEMLLLDGCFIVEFLHQTVELNTDEFIFKNDNNEFIMRDLILFENQLPFFILLELFEMTRELCSTQEYVAEIFRIFQFNFQDLRTENGSIENVNCLLDLVVRNWLPSQELMDNYSRAPKDAEWLFIRSATELSEAGISFKKGKGDSLFDIKFKNGVLEIPTIKINDDTESLYRNVIVCEQFRNMRPKYFTDFYQVIDNLINTGKDVELLCRHGIIDNRLGDDEVVATMINGLGELVSYDRSTFFYAQLYNDVNKYFNTPWNRRMANLRHKYFNTPWAFISFLAAVFLLLLTFLQTTFTIFPRT